MNNVMADSDGNIGFVAAGKLPKRKEGHSGMFAVRGDTSAADYDGYLSWDELFHITNPAEGFFATSNHRTTPLGVRYGVQTDAEVYFRVSRTRQLIQ
jgi:penicillin G amidase